MSSRIVVPTRDETAISGKERLQPMSAKSLKSRSTISLLPLAVRGDEQAAALLLDRMGHQLRRFGHGRLPRWARARYETDDLVQVSLFRGWKHLRRFDGQPSVNFLKWLAAVFKNLVTDETRRAARQGRIESLPDNLCDPEASVETRLWSKQRKKLLKAAMRELAPNEAALIHYRLDAHSFAEMATHFDKPSSDAARVAHNRALRKLKDEMKRQARLPSA